MRLIEILEDNGDVHVNDYHVTNNNERREVGDCQERIAAIAVQLSAGGRRIAIRRLHHQRLEDVVPSGGCHQPK